MASAEDRLHRALLFSILETVERVETQGVEMAKKLSEVAADIQQELDDLTANVASQSTIIASVEALLNGLVASNTALKQQIQELIDMGGDPAQIAKLEALQASFQAQEDALKANSQKLADAVAANTENPGDAGAAKRK